MADDGGLPLPDATPDPLTPELAPFVAQAKAKVQNWAEQKVASPS